MKKNILLLIICFSINFSIYAENQIKNVIHSGRYINPYLLNKGSFSFDLFTGKITSLEGKVEETKRANRDYNEKRYEYEKYLEEYTLDELGFNDSYNLLGLKIEKQWKYATFQMFCGFFDDEVSSTALNEPFAIGLEEVYYNGNKYEYMLIEQGDSFRTEIDGAILSMNFLVTPLHIKATSRVNFSPWLYLGLYSLGGKFEIDADEPRGITHYEYHDWDYVVGGRGKGYFGAGFPEWGFGGEISIDLNINNLSNSNLSFRFNIIATNWSGDTDDLGVNVRNEKTIDLDYDSTYLEVAFEMPVFSSSLLRMGIEYKTIKSFVNAEAKEKTEEEVKSIKEKYDKDITLEVDVVSFFIGLKF